VSSPHQPDAPNRDAATLALLRASHPDGLRHLLQDHGGVVLAKLRRVFQRVLDAAEIEETLGEAMVRVWQSPRHDPAVGTLRAWLFVIARNCALRRLRQRRLAPVPVDEFLDVLAWLDASPTHQERLHRIADFQGCLTLLPRLPRAVVQADLDADGTAATAELAAELGVTVEAIYRARARGRAELRTMMQRLGHFTDVEDETRRRATGPEPEFGA
jgi:RNA polymerase sigma-70 factor (ECF subfamily)